MLPATNATAVASQDFLIFNLGPGASRAIATTPVQLALNAIRRSEIARAIPALPVPNATEAARIFSSNSHQMLAVNRATAREPIRAPTTRRSLAASAIAQTDIPASATVTATFACTMSKEAACASIASTTLPAIDVKSAFRTFSAIRAKIRTIRLFVCVGVGDEICVVILQQSRYVRRSGSRFNVTHWKSLKVLPMTSRVTGSSQMKKFFCTAGKGIETFLATEITDRLDCSNV